MRVKQPNAFNMICEGLEPDALLGAEAVYIDGLRRVCLRRGGKHWDARFLGVARGSGSPQEHRPVADRAAAERMRAVNCNPRAGFLKSLAMPSHEAAALFAATSRGSIATIPKDLALHGRREGDIELPSDSGDIEWGLTTPLDSLGDSYRASSADLLHPTSPRRPGPRLAGRFPSLSETAHSGRYARTGAGRSGRTGAGWSSRAHHGQAAAAGSR